MFMRVLAGLLVTVVLCEAVAKWVVDCEESECSRFVCGPATRCIRGYNSDDTPTTCVCYLRVDCGGCSSSCGTNTSCVCTGMNCLPGQLDCPDVSCVYEPPTTTSLADTTTSSTT